MDQIPANDSELQRAIDDITKTTSVDPVFSDPVAAPSSVPEGDSGNMAEAVGPFPEPAFTMPPMPEVPEAFAMPPMPEAVAAPAMPEQPMAPEMPAPVPEMNMQQVKEAALRDLAPLLDKMPINASQKFRIYRDMFESLHNYEVLDPAYRAAAAIADETERGEALLYLVEAIDRM